MTEDPTETSISMCDSTDTHSPAFGGEDRVSNMSNGELGSA